MRIAVGGFQHETNTFAPVKADFAAFERADAWPRLVVGEELWDEIDGVHIPIAGAACVFRCAGAEMVPLSWASATPSAHVTEDAYERITGLLLDELRAALPVDAVYLDLHGAMVCEHFQDGEGELLRRVREVVGPDMPIAISLDLHANVTPEMVEHSDLIDIYRNYPHTDMAETGARAARHLLTMLGTGKKPAKAFRQADFLIPLQWGCTFHDPAKTLYGKNLLQVLETGITSISFACGFPLADIHHCGPSVVAYAEDQGTADEAADAMIASVQAAEADFAGKIYQPDEAVRLGHNADDDRPLVVADSQDNPGGGGPGDTTGMLRALLAAGRQDSLIGVFTDPATADKAHEVGVGGIFDARIGGKLFPGDEPVEVEAKVISLGDGVFKGTGPMWGGANFQMGKMALLDCNGVHVAVMSNSMQAGDQSMFRHLGAEPSDYDLVIVKSSVHFRADFQPIARDVWVAAAPGPVYADPGALSFFNLRNGVATRPRA
ncbi:M81 family metallopeptidase [Hwanghaeella sp.]|uniref:M81 family metallopeptidase n=1 Tax=Hwanghaeella sp. TaxID=2605943 RepID=UPI003CCBFD4B